MSELLASQSNLNAAASSANDKSAQSQDSDRTLLLETLIDLAPDAIFVADLNGILIEVNDRSCQLLGYGREELLGKAIADMLAPEELPRLKSLEKLLVQGFTQTDVWTQLHQDGSRIPSEVSFKVLPGGQRVAFVRDLRDRLQLEGDRQHALARLQASEERLQLALRGAGQGIWDWNLKADVLMWDDRCKKIFGLPSDVPVSYEWHVNALHPDDRQRVSDAATVALRDRTEFDEEYRTFHPDGKMRWVLARGRGYYDVEGQPSRMSGTVLDITERKEAEAAFQQKVQEAEAAQQTLAALMAYIPEGITIAAAPDVTIRQVSRYGQQLTGRSPEVIEGIPVESHAQNWGIFYPDGITPAANEALPLTRAVQQGEVVTNEEWLLRRPDGQQIVTLCNAGPIYDGNGEITGGVIAWRDISDRKQAVLALQEKEQELQQLCDSMPQFVWVCNAQGELQYINQQWIEYSGLTLEQSLDPQNIADTHHPDDIQVVLDQWGIALETQQPFEMEARLRRASDGEYRWFLIRTVPVFDDQGQLLRWYGTSTDIHDRKLDELNRQFLLELDRRLRQFDSVDSQIAELTRCLGEYLAVSHCHFLTVDEAAASVTIHDDWSQQGDNQAGTYRFSDFLPADSLSAYRAGQVVAVADVASDPVMADCAQNYLAYGVQAFAGAPCHYADRWVGILGVNSAMPRQWSAAELNLLQEVVHRSWPFIEQTRVTQALKEQEERTRLATEAAQLGMWFWDIPRDELVWTDRCKALFGFPPEAQISYEVFLKALHPDDRDRTDTAVTRALEQGVEYDIEYRTVWSDRTVHWIAAKGRAFFDASGKAIRMMGTAQDISDRQQTEADLQERTQHIQLLYETTRDLLSTDQPLTLVAGLFAKLKPMIGLDVYINYLLNEERQQLHLMFYGGLPEATAREIEWLEIGRAVCGTVAQQRSQIVQSDVQNSTDPKAELIKTLGLTAYSCQPLVAQGKLFGTLGFGSRNRTHFSSAATSLFQALCDQIAIALERSRLVLSLQQQTEELKTTNRLKDDFFSALSHELRTPLNPILGWTKMMQGQKLTPEKVTQALETIERNVCHQINLVDDLLDVSRVIQGKMRLDLHPVDLVGTLTAAIESVEFSAQAKGVALHFPHPDAVYTEGDGDRLQQVFWNILANAIKFTPDGGRVEIELSVTNGSAKQYAQVRITDTGIGIAPEFMPHIFEYFRQAEGGSKRNYGGLGLGLAIVRHLVELHGGTVTAASPGLGQGTTFTVKLPLLGSSPADSTPVQSNFTHSQENFAAPVVKNVQLSDKSPPPTTSTPITSVTPSSRSLSGVRILLVDDEPDNLELLKFILAAEGAVLTAFTSPTHALQFLSQSPPDLLISDIGMPQMNGYEFLQSVRSLSPEQGGQVKAIAITAYAQKSDQERVLAVGYQAYIAKPIDIEQVVTTITQLLG